MVFGLRINFTRLMFEHLALLSLHNRWMIKRVIWMDFDDFFQRSIDLRKASQSPKQLRSDYLYFYDWQVYDFTADIKSRS
jgi:hypothetical protein